jgi:hypothetical protein
MCNPSGRLRNTSSGLPQYAVDARLVLANPDPDGAALCQTSTVVNTRNNKSCSVVQNKIINDKRLRNKKKQGEKKT